MDAQTQDVVIATIVEIAKRSGLNEETVEDLLQKGWVWRESINDMPSFTKKF